MIHNIDVHNGMYMTDLTPQARFPYIAHTMLLVGAPLHVGRPHRKQLPGFLITNSYNCIAHCNPNGDCLHFSTFNCGFSFFPCACSPCTIGVWSGLHPRDSQTYHMHRTPSLRALDGLKAQSSPAIWIIEITNAGWQLLNTSSRSIFLH